MNRKELLEKRRKARELLKRKSARAKASTKKFKQELKKSTNIAITAAFGFLMGLAWRDVIVEYVAMLTEVSPIKGKLVSAIIITIISVLGILAVTKIFQTKE